MKFQISDLDSFRSGIYKISSRNSEYVYIGSTYRFIERYNSHRVNFQRGKGISRKLIQFCILVGYENLIFSLVELCEKAELNEREQFHIMKHPFVLNSFGAPKRNFLLKNRKVRVYASINENSLNSINKISDKFYEGNFSLCLRLIIEAGLKTY